MLVALPESNRLPSAWGAYLMTTKAYMLIAIGGFITVVTGSDLIARMTIAGDTFGSALNEHLHWASLTIVGVFVLFIPFGGAALICGAVNKKARTRSAMALFLVAMAGLAYFYFNGFQASQQAVLNGRWTAAALSIGLLPFFVGLPLLGIVAIVAAIVARVDQR
jgi:hypothetical protein